MDQDVEANVRHQYWNLISNAQICRGAVAGLILVAVTLSMLPFALLILVLLVLVAVLSVTWAYASPRGGQQPLAQAPLQIVIQTGRGLILVQPGVWMNEAQARSVTRLPSRLHSSRATEQPPPLFEPVPLHHSPHLAFSFPRRHSPFWSYHAMDMLAFVVVGEPQPSSPVTEDMLASLPTHVVEKESDSTAEHASGNDVCAVCLEDYKAGDCVQRLTCTHAFHASCLKPWLRQKGMSATCPMCKHPVWERSTNPINSSQL